MPAVCTVKLVGPPVALRQPDDLPKARLYGAQGREKAGGAGGGLEGAAAAPDAKHSTASQTAEAHTDKELRPDAVLSDRLVGAFPRAHQLPRGCHKRNSRS